MSIGTEIGKCTLRAAIVAAGLNCLAPVAMADQLSDIMQRKELRCGTFADVHPFAAPDAKTREMVGFDVDLCRAIAKRWGVEAKISPLSVEARVPEVKLAASTSRSPISPIRWAAPSRSSSPTRTTSPRRCWR